MVTTGGRYAASRWPMEKTQKGRLAAAFGRKQSVPRSASRSICLSIVRPSVVAIVLTVTAIWSRSRRCRSTGGGQGRCCLRFDQGRRVRPGGKAPGPSASGAQGLLKRIAKDQRQVPALGYFRF